MPKVIIKKCGTEIVITGPSTEQIFQLLSKEATEGTSIQVVSDFKAPSQVPETAPDSYTWKVTSSSWIDQVTYVGHYAGEYVLVYGKGIAVGCYYCDWSEMKKWMTAKSVGSYFNKFVKQFPL